MIRKTTHKSGQLLLLSSPPRVHWHSSSRKIILCRFINRFLSSFVSLKFIVINGQRNKILMLTDFPLMSFCDLWLEIAQKSRSIVVMCLNNNNNLWLTLSDIYVLLPSQMERWMVILSKYMYTLCQMSFRKCLSLLSLRAQCHLLQLIGFSPNLNRNRILFHLLCTFHDRLICVSVDQ